VSIVTLGQLFSNLKSASSKVGFVDCNSRSDADYEEAHSDKLIRRQSTSLPCWAFEIVRPP